MTKKKELELEELEKVAGGFQVNTSDLRGKVGAHIAANDVRNYKGRKVFVVDDEYSADWVRGTLNNSYDDTSGCSERIIHEVDVSYCNFMGTLRDIDGNSGRTGVRRFDSEEVTIYLWEDDD